MGNGHSTDLTCIQQFFNACQMAEITKSVKGIPGNSSSPTDTWVLQLDEKACYLNADIKRAFIKIHINSSSFNPIEGKFKNEEELQALEYEIRVYRDIVRPLVDLDICPHFVRYLAHSTNCSKDSLVNILKKDSNLNNYSLERFERSIAFMANSITAQEQNLTRPSIESNEALPDVLKIPIHPNWKFNVLATEAVREEAMTLEKYMESDNVPEDFWNVVFQ